jgi:phage shock protein E
MKSLKTKQIDIMKFSKITLVMLIFCFTQNILQAQTKTATAAKPATTAKTTTTPKKKVPMLEVDITPAELKQLTKDFPEITVIDVRTKAEVAQGKIPGAIHVEWGSPEFTSKMKTLDKTKPYIVYCAVGGRSTNAQRLMKFNDFLNVANLKGGYKEYSKG